jgi:hypothetical protein
MRKKAAIELSANFIVVIVISIVILSAGLIIFTKFLGGGKTYVDTIEDQTKSQLRSLMTANNDKLALYKNSITLNGKGSDIVTLGVTNVLGNASYFKFSVKSVKYYIDLNNEIDITNTHGWQFGQDKNIYSNSNGTLGIVRATEQAYKNILVKMPKDAQSGNYIVTFLVQSCDQNYTSCVDYGVTKLYINKP